MTYPRRRTSRTHLIWIGCEIMTISAEAKEQFLTFIEAEEKFRGIGRQSRSSFGVPKKDVIPDSKKHLQLSSKTILTVSGGSPQNRSLQTVLNWIEDELRCSGHHVEHINLIAKTVKGCDGCGRCSVPDIESSCIQKDDVQAGSR